jgi:hypothetical protein
LIFLFRYRSHSMEILPFRTSGEFSAFVNAHFEKQKDKSPELQSSEPRCMLVTPRAEPRVAPAKVVDSSLTLAK